MNTAQLVIVCVTVLLLAIVAAGVVTAQATRKPVDAPAFGPEPGCEVAVHVGDGQSVRGKLEQRTPAGLVLTGAAVISEGKETALGGKAAHVPAHAVTMVQEL